jgi:23S rRNA (cytosine1962-C5)-methyltransferase
LNDLNQTNLATFENQFKLGLQLRSAMIDPKHESTLRLFNGYYEGYKGFVVDLYACAAVVSDHNKVDAQAQNPFLDFVVRVLQETYPWLESILLKRRASLIDVERNGILIFGSKLPSWIAENGVRYAIDLRLNQDESFFLDTRFLRQWLKEQSLGKSLLNCFAYSGTLGIAALAGQARRVLQTDINPSFLELAKKSAKLSRYPGEMKILALDFFKVVSRIKTSGELFDIVILDPPFFSTTKAGRVDLLADWIGLINKARPLVADGGKMVVINNALFATGAEVQTQLESLFRGGYVEMDTTIPVPEDCTGFPETILEKAPVDTAPYNHSTKISILTVHRKDGRKAGL